MKKIGSLRIRIVAEDKKLEREAEILAFTTGDAIKRAVIAYLGSLGLLVICIPIPLVHFIAVPTLLIMGPFLAVFIFKIYFQQEEFRLADTPCPKCNTLLNLPTTAKLWPVRDRCPECRVSYQAEVLGEERAL